jgi:diguanylate cyclase (GGDEF)-like protein
MMSRKIGRNVRLRTAICDYFCSIRQVLKNPVMVEIHVFENTIKNIKFDRLTGLYTRAYFEESLNREVGRAKRYQTDLSILFFDLDDFKKINDNYGHQAGDFLLESVSEIILKQIRAEDIASRYGGEEIIIILPETGKVQALILGERIRRKIAENIFHYEGNELRMTLSGGLASLPIDTTSPSNLVKFADAALYRAKADGKNSVAIFSENKRRYVRVDFCSEVQIQEIGFEDIGKQFAANAKNISLTGILFESDISMEIGTKINLSIPLVEFKSTIQVLGTVVRVESMDEDLYDIGIAFLEVTDSSKNEISNYLLQKMAKGEKKKSAE